jgi:hypothetical protein
MSGIDLDSLPIRANVGCPCTPELACSKTQAPTRGSWTHEECLAQKHRRVITHLAGRQHLAKCQAPGSKDNSGWLA